MQTTQAHPSSTLTELVNQLDGSGPIAPWRARLRLVQFGEPAVPELVRTLKVGNSAVRWEAAKALSEIGSPNAIDALVSALSDEDGGVRWIAAEGLSRIGRPALIPLLTTLMNHADNGWLRDGAHHVLRWLRDPALAEVLDPVVRALDTWEPALNTIRAVDQALDALHRIGDSRPASPPRQVPDLRAHAVARMHSSPGPWRSITIRELGVDEPAS